jgi:hypothetical protein
MTRNTKLLAAIAVASVFVAQPASAYQCKTYPSQSHGIAATKLAAQAKSKSNWSNNVKSSLGLAWSVWAIAKDRTVDCVKLNSGQWRCLASAKPCLYVVP